MRVVHVYKDFCPPVMAGITRYLRDIADESARRGLDVAVHVAGVWSPRIDLLPSGVQVHRHREIGRPLSTPLAPGLMAIPRRPQGDLLHVHMPNPSSDLGVAIATTDRPIVVSYHAQLGRQRFLEPFYGPIRERVLARATAVLVSSEGMLDIPELAAVRSKTAVLPYGVSPSTIAETEPPPHRDAPELRVLFVGRLVYYKGLDVLLRAVAQTNGITVTIVGEGPLEESLRRLADRLGIDDRVSFAGYVTDERLRQLYALHDACVLPSVSRSEAFGLSMAEAMANGLPAVSTHIGTGTDWVNIDGETGLVVPPEDAAALANAFVTLRSPVERERLAVGARKRAARLFSFDRHVDRLMELYEDLVRASTPAAVTARLRVTPAPPGGSLVIGAAGYVGTFVRDALEQANVAVTATSRTPGRAEEHVTSATELQRVLAAGEFSQVVLTAPLGSPGVGELVELVDGPRWVVLSSAQLASAVPAPGTDAAIARERRALELGASVIRPTMVYGHGRDQNLSRVIRLSARLRVSVQIGDGHQLVQPLHVDDLAALVAAHRRHAVSGLFSAGSAEVVAWRDLVAMLSGILGIHFRPLRVRSSWLHAVAPLRIAGLRRDQVLRLEEDKAVEIAMTEAAFEWKPLPLADRLAQAVAEALDGEVLDG